MSLNSSGWTFDSACWETVPLSDGQYRYRCKICCDSLPHEQKNLARHEKTQKHQSTAEYRRATQPDVSGPSLHSGEPGSPVDSTQQAQELDQLNEDLVDDATRYLLASITGDVGEAPYPEDPALPGRDSLTYYDPSPVTGIQWGLGSEEPREDSVMSKAAADVARATLQFLNNNDLSDEEVDERPRDSEEDTGVTGDEDPRDPDTLHEAKRARNFATDPETARNWYPWQDKITCTLDILMHLPRSVFSQKQLDLFIWILSVNGVPDVPTVTQMQDINKLLQNMCGIGTQLYEGVLGHRYYMNSLGDILAQEMANPKVRPNLHVYPEDTGKYRREARQSDRWLHELPAELKTPMVRIGEGNDYYIHEPAMLDSGVVCMPIRWFERDGSLCGRAWKMIQVRYEDQDGWCVRCDEEFEFPTSQLLKNFLSLKNDHSIFSVPSPSLIHGTCSLGTQNDIINFEPWTLTNPSLGNRWRSNANGSRVVAIPLWMYCDDTSGNVSKKWNEHNSFLFTLAGLPGNETAREYNRRFAFEHQDYLNTPEPEESQQVAMQSTSHKRTSTGQVKAVGRVANGLDFWSRVDQWFAGEITNRGGNRDLMGEVWRPYCEETILWDNGMFDNPVPTTSAAPSALGVQPAGPVTTATPGPSANTRDGDEDILGMMV